MTAERLDDETCQFFRFEKISGTDVSNTAAPAHNKVLDTWGISWETYMASLGYLVVCVDGRGTGGRGEAFEKCTYLKIGVKEARDQVETALYLGKQPYVDKDRIGIWGWSYGGYMTLMSMSEGTSRIQGRSSSSCTHRLAFL